MEHISLAKERTEAVEQLIEAMRMVNEIIRHVHKTGLDIKVDVLTAYNEARPMPQVSFWTPGWPKET